MQESPLKVFHKSHSTMLTSNPLMEEETDYQKLLVRKKSREDKIDFFSENNSLFELKNEDADPFFFSNTGLPSVQSPKKVEKSNFVTTQAFFEKGLSIENRSEKKKRKKQQSEV